MASAFTIITRGITTSSVCHGKRNFRKFLLYNKRANPYLKEQQRNDPNCDIPIDHRGVRRIGYRRGTKHITIPEMIPEIIVPSLEGFKLKPYVSYNIKSFEQPAFTAKDLFNLVYAKKIKEDFEKGELDPNGEPLHPSENEKMTPQEAKDRAGKTGCDIFAVD